MTAIATRTTSAWVPPFVGALFLISVLGAQVWFSRPAQTDQARFSFATRPQPKGRVLNQVPLNESALEILATTNIINGNFEAGPAGRISVFLANWEGKDARQMSVVQHTPDICWVGAGFTALDLGQPAMVKVAFGTNQLPFECRIMSPRGGSPELTMWCTLVGGRPIEEGFRFSNAELLKQSGGRTRLASRLRGLNMFFNAIEKRTRSDGSKQFVRVSMPLRGSWEKAVPELSTFLGEWLVANVSSATGAAKPSSP